MKRDKICYLLCTFVLGWIKIYIYRLIGVIIIRISDATQEAEEATQEEEATEESHGANECWKDIRYVIYYVFVLGLNKNCLYIYR